MSAPPVATVAFFTLPRSPAVAVAVAFGVGVTWDRLAGSPTAAALVLSAVALAVWYLLRDHGVRVTIVPLLIAFGALGSAWHHSAWTTVRRDHLAGVAVETPRPIKLVGIVRDTPFIVPPREQLLSGGAPQTDRTLCLLDVLSVVNGKQQIPMTGLARLEVGGHLLGVAAGDRVEVVGRVARPAGPQNPGGFDFRAYLRASGIHVVVRSSEPECVSVLEPGRSPRRWTGRVRQQAERMLNEQLSTDTAPIGVAMMLGTRTALPEDVRDAFRKSGTMHVLAISGLHVAILAGLVWVVCRALNVGRRLSLGLGVAAILAYATITEAQPPVVRSVIMISLLVAGQYRFRAGSLLQNLALAALGVMVWNPTHLFDAGAQLSFLAVAALGWAPAWQRAPQPVATDGPVLRLGRGLGHGIWATLEATAAVWLFTLPLTASLFHMVSPAGFLANVVLAPLSVLILWCGYLLLIVGLAVPPLAVLFGWAFDFGLRGLLWIVTETANSPLGSFPVAGPPAWWMVGFYLAIFGVLVTHGRDLFGKLALRSLAAWSVLGLGVGLIPASRPAGLSATFLSVGHGVAVLVETPNGKTLLYDAGQLQDAGRAEQIVEAALWERGRTSIDALVMSHADVDHFNAVPGLAEEGLLRTVLLHPTFLDFDQVPVQTVCDRCAAQGVPIRFLWRGDRVRLDPEVEIEVLHPDVTARHNTDNANSLTLRIRYAGRSVLLTGDLEGTGLGALLTRPREPVDALLAPHHGSQGANTPELAAWTAPAVVVASTGYEGVEHRLKPLYGDSTLIRSTRERGAVTIRITPEGELECDTFRKE